VDFNKNENAAQIGGGVFLVGLGMLFLTGWWWPGIMFVMAASILARTMAEGKPMMSASGALWLIGIGIVFGLPGLVGGIAGSLWQLLPVILIGMGLFMFFGGRYRPKMDKYEDNMKRKNEDDDIYNV